MKDAGLLGGRCLMKGPETFEDQEGSQISTQRHVQILQPQQHPREERGCGGPDRLGLLTAPRGSHLGCHS